LIIGRTVFHFHTRTKTGRTPELQAAAPRPWVELSPDDAHERGIALSKQPLFKAGAVSVSRVAPGAGPAPAPDQAASAPASRPPTA
jgi:hypothetical protein